MGLIDFLLRIFFPRRQRSCAADEGAASAASPAAASQAGGNHRPADGRRPSLADDPLSARAGGSAAAVIARRKPVRLTPLHNDRRRARHQRNGKSWSKATETSQQPYRFARLGVTSGGYLDLASDGDSSRLAARGLPQFHTPEELAEWLELPLGKAAWLIDRFTTNQRPDSVQTAHYHYQWKRKRKSGWRLIESPKSTLRQVQMRILREILDHVPAHRTAHGFVRGRSIVTNAQPHVGRQVVLKVDLKNFYANVTFSRVVAIFRSLGYSREAAIWLGRLTTSALPQTIPFPENDASAILPFLRRHLPQGAPTSPALANLSAFSLDLRLSGLARSFGAQYTRYADDLTFSGDESFSRSFRTFIPLVRAIIRNERFQINQRKLKILRQGARQTVAGVVVNQRPNISRAEFDRLKATLHNCVRSGPESQNRENHPDFAAHLRGRIAHVAQLNPARGRKLQAIFERIRW